MLTLQVPEQFVVGLIAIGSLKDTALLELTRELPHISVAIEPDEIVRLLSSKVKSISKKDLREVLKTLIGITQVKKQLDIATSEIVPLICNAMSRSTNENLKHAGEKCENFSDRLVQLLNADSIELLAKAAGIVTDYDCVFLRADILSDVRAIFGPDTESLPKSAAIIHTLSVAYRQNGESKNFYVAMSSKDLETLINTLNRAVSKEKGLKKVLDAANVPFLKTE